VDWRANAWDSTKEATRVQISVTGTVDVRPFFGLL
jgi:hypothetical protein